VFGAAMNYGSQTVCRPRADSPGLGGRVPAGAAPAECPYCGRACWKLPQEPDPLPPDTTAACTACAINRGMYQREMDARRARREAVRGCGRAGGRDGDQ
jgi:hypothetical protein